MASFLRVAYRTLLTLAYLAAAATAAVAQTPSPLAYWQNSAGIVLAPLGGPVHEWRTVVGAGIAATPLYEGSSRVHLTPAPAFDIRYKDIAFLSSGDGLGVNLLRGPDYRAGIAIGYDLGRWQHLTGRLNGLGSISPAPEVKLFAEYAFLPFVLSGNIRRAIGGHDGFIGDLGFYLPVVATKPLIVFVGPNVTFADDRYMQAYFGVNPDKAAPVSRFPAFRAHGGIKNANFGVTAIYNIDEHWLIDGDVGVERLLDSAADSPIVEQRWQVGASVILAYKF